MRLLRVAYGEVASIACDDHAYSCSKLGGDILIQAIYLHCSCKWVTQVTQLIVSQWFKNVFNLALLPLSIVYDVHVLFHIMSCVYVIVYTLRQK